MLLAGTEVIENKCTEEQSREKDRSCAHKFLEKITQPSANCRCVYLVSGVEGGVCKTRNTPEHPGKHPEHPGTPPEYTWSTRNTPGTPSEHSGTPPKHPGTSHNAPAYPQYSQEHP